MSRRGDRYKSDLWEQLQLPADVRPMSATEISRYISATTGTDVSRQAVEAAEKSALKKLRSALGEVDLSCIPVDEPIITSEFSLKKWRRGHW